MTPETGACHPGDPVGLPPLARLAARVYEVMSDVAAAHGLSVVQARMVLQLRHRSLRMAELARATGVEKAALTGLVDRAERRGLVAREPVPGDRRAIDVRLTDDGRRAAQDFQDGVTDAMDELVAHLPVRDRADLLRLVTDLLDVSAPRARAAGGVGCP
ncbi:MarR family winged helix-turn-helix transcriptional regulator [Myceligenerans cantabricum]